MSKTINDYFQNELKCLEKSLQYFSKEYPEASSRLNVDADGRYDPNIARLLEGCAYLQARTMQQIDLGVHHLSETLLRQLAPYYLSPKPSKTIIEFKSPHNRLIEPHCVPVNTVLQTHPLGEEKTMCEFTTIEQITVQPMHLIACHYNYSIVEKPCLHLSFSWNDGVIPAAMKPTEIVLYINASRLNACKWYHYLTQRVLTVFIKQGEQQTLRVGGQEKVQPMYPSCSQNMQTSLIHQRNALEALSDYFYFPEQFCFIKCDISSLQIQEHSFQLIIEFCDGQSDLSAHSELFKLHCAPACNMFHYDSEPILYQKKRREYPLVLCHQAQNSKRLLSLKRVVGLSKTSWDEHELHDFGRMPHYGGAHGYYRLLQVNHKGLRPEHQLIFSGSLPEELYVRCEVLAYNAHYPREHMNINALSLKNDYSPMFLAATNVSRPSLSFLPVFDGEYALHVLSSLNAQLSAWSDVSFLKRLLHLHDWSHQHGQLIAGIQHVELKPFNRIMRGILQRGLTWRIVVRDELQHSSEFYLLGMVLHHCIISYAPMNIYVETVMQCSASDVCYFWSDHNKRF